MVLQLKDSKLITRMNVKKMHELLPKRTFLRVNRSFVVNKNYIDSFDSNDVYIKNYEISIGSTFRDDFLRDLMGN